jgi:hypothetical protein
MQLFLLSFPLWMLFIVLVLGGALLAGAASWLVGHHVHRQPDENDVGLAIFQTVGAIFGITLAFTISAVYGEFEAATSNVSQESNDVRALYRLTTKLPEPQRADFHSALQTYAQRVVDSEWASMTRGQESAEVNRMLERLWQIQRDLPAEAQMPPALEERLYQHLHHLTDHRRNRLLDSRSQLAPLMWALLLGGGVVTVAFAIYLRTGNNRSQAVMAGALAAVVGFGLLLVMALDCPYSGSMHVPADPIRDTLLLFNPDGA